MEKNTINNGESGNSLTPVRPPAEDIIAGASKEDQIKRLQENAEQNPMEPEEEIGTSPTAYPGPEDGE